MSSWQQTAPGRFARPFDLMESFFVNLARETAPINREHWAINVTAQFRAPFSYRDVLSRLKNAWITMRYDHPEIASRAEGDTKVYEVPSASDLDAWLQETFNVAADATSIEDLVASIQPQPLASIYFLPRTYEILIHASHWRMDGNGAVSLLNNFFEAVSKPRPAKFGDEGKNLSPSRDNVLSSALAGIGSGDESQIDKAATDLVSTLRDNMPSLGLPDFSPDAVPLGTRRLEQQFDTKTTSRIISACKTLDVSVTTAVHSALLLATQQFASEESSANNYASFGVFSLRSGLPSPFNDSAVHATSVYILGLPLVISPSTFAQNLSQLRDIYKQPLAPSAKGSLAPLIIPYQKGLNEFMSQELDPDTVVPAATEPILSSLGVLDQSLDAVHGDVEIINFTGGLEVDTRQIVFHLLTWQGKMVLGACYNEAFYEAPFVREYLSKISTILLAELRVDNQKWRMSKM